jgi:hypothetical protein
MENPCIVPTLDTFVATLDINPDKSLNQAQKYSFLAV